MRVIRNRSEEDLRQLALDIYRERVFTSWQIRDGDFKNLARQIFMPLLFMKTEQVPRNAAMIYAPYAQRLPRTINGYPMFMECAFINKGDAVKLWNLVEKIKAAAEGAA